MGRLSILTGSLTTLQLPSSALRMKAAPMPPDVAPDLLRTLITEMFAAMYHVNGRGLAGPQVGVLWRLFVLDMQQSASVPPLVLINPELLDMDDVVVHGREGCLSIPGYMSRKVPRAATIKMAGLNQHGERVVHEVDGDVARAMQHEYDHLDGVLYIDRLGSTDDLEPYLDAWLTKAEHVVEQILDAPPVQHEPAAG
jgi:peptide deformylase